MKLKLKLNDPSSTKSPDNQKSEGEGLSEEEDDHQELHGSRKKSTPRKTWPSLDDEEEEDMVRFLRDNECIYNKKLKSYRNKPMKDRLWEEQAASLGRSVEDIQHWFESVRTRYGRISKDQDMKCKKSGSGSMVVSLTERETWIMQNFAFLRQHIVRVHGSSCVSLKSKISSVKPATSSFVPEDTETETEDDVRLQAAEDDVATDEGQVTNMQAKKHSRKRRRRYTAEDEELVNILRKRQDTGTKVEEHMDKVLKNLTPSDSKEDWGTWLKSSCKEISDDHFMEFQMESLKLVQKYKRLSKKQSAAVGTSGSSTPACQVTNIQLPPQTDSSPPIATVLNSMGQPMQQHQVQQPLHHQQSFGTIDNSSGIFGGQNYSSSSSSFFPPPGNH